MQPGGRADDAVAAFGFGDIQFLVRRIQCGAGIGIFEQVGDPGGESYLAERHVVGAVDQAPFGQVGAGLVKQIVGLGERRSAQQDDEFLAAMAGNMAAIVGNLVQGMSDDFEDPVAGIMAKIKPVSAPQIRAPSGGPPVGCDRFRPGT